MGIRSTLNYTDGIEIKDFSKSTGIEYVIDARGGNDVITGGGLDDWIWGGSGDDTLRGGNGVDHLEGGDGIDKLWGDRGNDALYGGRGNDTLIGGAGNDTFHFWKGDGVDTIRDYAIGDKVHLYNFASVANYEASVTDVGLKIDFGADELIFSGLSMGMLSQIEFVYD